MELKQILKQADLKTTGTRLAVLSYLEEASMPLTADEIFAHIHAEHDGADKATIYRILDSFHKKGIISRLEFQEGKFRYELAGSEHHHLICEQCGSIEDFSDCNIEALQKDIRKKKGFSVKRHALEFYGLCTSCQQ